MLLSRRGDDINRYRWNFWQHDRIWLSYIDRPVVSFSLTLLWTTFGISRCMLRRESQCASRARSRYTYGVNWCVIHYSPTEYVACVGCSTSWRTDRDRNLPDASCSNSTAAANDDDDQQGRSVTWMFVCRCVSYSLIIHACLYYLPARRSRDGLWDRSPKIWSGDTNIDTP